MPDAAAQPPFDMVRPERDLSMPVPVADVVNRFLELADREGNRISPLELQKLVYFAHGWHLALSGEPLIDDEPFEAWDFGPVLRSVYDAFKSFGGQPIVDRRMPHAHRATSEPMAPGSFAERVVDRVWKKYGHLTGGEMVARTHGTNSPWRQVYKPRENRRIPGEIIHEHFESLKEISASRRPVQGS